MNDEPLPQTPTPDQLRRECHDLIEQIYKSRLNVKLLLIALNCLQMLTNYKGNRRRWVKS